MIVAIHQPNYAPWLGYFAKMAKADVFVFLDDVQFSKNSYINRVQVDCAGQARWLSVPVSFRFGDPINAVKTADSTWTRGHGEKLKSFYGKAPHFSEVWSWLSPLLLDLPTDSVAATNQALIEGISARLGMTCRFLKASTIDVGHATSDDRLIAILGTIGSDISYLSGKGGASYQTPQKFQAAGISLVYSEFAQKPYEQGHEGFLPGLSVLDALFRVGVASTAQMIKSTA